MAGGDYASVAGVAADEVVLRPNSYIFWWSPTDTSQIPAPYLIALSVSVLIVVNPGEIEGTAIAMIISPNRVG